MSAWDVIVQMHRGVDWSLLGIFYGGIAAILIFAALQVIRSRQGAIAREARDRVAGFQERLEGLRSELQQAEDSLKHRLTEGMAGLAGQIGSAEAKGVRAMGEIENVRRHMEQIEGSMPNLYDELKEFRDMLSRVFRNELGAVLNSFDGSLTAVLDHMKADLHMGISRIESIESMVKSRQWAEHALLPSAEADETARAEQPAQATAEHTPAEVTKELADLSLEEAQSEGAQQWEEAIGLQEEAALNEEDAEVSATAEDEPPTEDVAEAFELSSEEAAAEQESAAESSEASGEDSEESARQAA